jgi:hypothetical protein
MREVLQAAPKTCTMSHRGDCVCACECERFFRLRQRHALCHTGASVCASMSARGAAGCAKDMHYVTTTVYALNRVLGGILRRFRLRQRHALCHTGASVCASMSARGAAGCAKDMHYVTTTVYALNRVLGGILRRFRRIERSS